MDCGNMARKCHIQGGATYFTVRTEKEHLRPSSEEIPPASGGNVGIADKGGPLRGERAGTALAVTEGVFNRCINVFAHTTKLLVYLPITNAQHI